MVKAAMPPREPLDLEDHAQTYGLSANNIFLRFYDTSMNHFYNGRLVKARDFGQKLVLDCGYDLQMSRRENQNAAKQLMLLFSDNRFHKGRLGGAAPVTCPIDGHCSRPL